MAHRNTGSYSMRRMREGHRHQLIDVNEFLEKKKVVAKPTKQPEHPKPPEPQCHDVLNLTKLLERTINASSRVLDSALGRKRTALDLLRDRSLFPDNYTFSAYYGRPQPHSPSSNHDHATEVDLVWFFAIFNTIFFMNALPTNTRCSIFASSSGSAFVDNVHAGFKRRVDHKFLPPTIGVPSSHIDFSGTEHVVPWEDQVGSLLGSMIDLFIQYYSCRQVGCWNDKYTHGKKHRGKAWQIIAYRFETSSTIKDTQEALGSPINLRRREDYEWDLNHWSIEGLDNLERKLLHRRIETWGWAPYSQLSCVRAVREMKQNQAIIDEEMRAIARDGEIRQAMARDEERRSMKGWLWLEMKKDGLRATLSILDLILEPEDLVLRVGNLVSESHIIFLKREDLDLELESTILKEYLKKENLALGQRHSALECQRIVLNRESLNIEVQILVLEAMDLVLKD
ncbi:hypothetical protein BHYA_0092g00130 [Botrytis hyacinthi]|uniref:Uncharacterized protein n=1 Tax=Botrytis hyacinthi TaxID=278943 RepID=A0A4Z1GQZ7_9HELO|nr:hypothetical protein BHYA_0092g00130 [Botrytis hyacinthi]